MNTMWKFIFGFFAVAGVASIIFLWSRFCKFGIVNKLAKGNKKKKILFGFLPLLIFGVFFIIDSVNTAIVMIHMSIYFLIAELFALIIRKIRKKDQKDSLSGQTFKPYIVGIVVIAFELVYFTSGFFIAHHVVETDYSVVTAKDLNGKKIRIALIADSHIGSTFNGETFAKHIETIQAANPDILVITGDFVDDGTKKDDMLRSCEALATLNCPLGKYYVFGNHDKGYNRSKNFANYELTNALAIAGVRVLEDKTILVDDTFYIIGRKDKSDNSRKPISELVKDLDPSKYSIVLDHQPTDYDNEAAANVDLVLSGHTHGGQLIAMRIAAELMKANDSNYGMETRGNTKFIVTSGIGDWTIQFKTGTLAEYCIVEISN